MIINYDIETIREFLNHFHKITNFTISFWDNELNQLSYQPCEMPKFCRMIKSSPEGARRCYLSDTHLCGRCRDSLTPETHKCHAGLVDTAVPIMFEDKLFGFIMFGQVKDPQYPKNSVEEIKRLGDELGLPADELAEAYEQLYRFDSEMIDSAAKILTATMYYLYSSACKFTESELINRIDKWIDDNLSAPISVTILCNEFDISKNKLYAIWKNRFGMTIGDYILERRMKRAKKLLLQADDKINVVCEKVGIPDYNYFSKVFKKFYSISPSGFRKRYK